MTEVRNFTKKIPYHHFSPYEFPNISELSLVTPLARLSLPKKKITRLLKWANAK